MGGGETAEGYEVSFRGVGKILKLPSFVTFLKSTRLYTLNGWVMSYVNYISMQLFQNAKEKVKEKGILQTLIPTMDVYNFGKHFGV